MKQKSTQNTFKHLYASFALVILALFSACKSSEETPTNFGWISVYNASPTLSTYDVYLNNSKFNAAALPFGGGVKYTQVLQNTYQAKFTIAGETASVYTKESIIVGANSYATLFLVGTAPNFDGLLVTDNSGVPNAEKAYVRFINLSPDAPALDLNIKDGSAVTTNKAYKTYGDFTAVDPGAKVFEIKETASGTVKSTLESVTLNKGLYYTVISRGKLNPSNVERAFSGQVIQHQ